MLPTDSRLSDFQKACARLDTIAELWNSSHDQLRTEFIAEVFKRKRLEGKTLYLWPKPEYIPPFGAYVYTMRARGDSVALQGHLENDWADIVA